MDSFRFVDDLYGEIDCLLTPKLSHPSLSHPSLQYVVVYPGKGDMRNKYLIVTKYHVTVVKY